MAVVEEEREENAKRRNLPLCKQKDSPKGLSFCVEEKATEKFPKKFYKNKKEELSAENLSSRLLKRSIAMP